MFHTMHMSSYSKMYMSRYTTKRWISSDAWGVEQPDEKSLPPTFMCCFKLETGGLFIAWFGLITNFLLLVATICAVLLIPMVGCRGFENCDGAIIFLAIMLMPFLVSFIAMSYSCLKGVKKRDHKQIKSMMFYLGLISALSFLSVFTFIIPVVIVGTILGLLFLYFFTAIYSLYDIFLIESKQANEAVAPSVA